MDIVVPSGEYADTCGLIDEAPIRLHRHWLRPLPACTTTSPCTNPGSPHDDWPRFMSDGRKSLWRRCLCRSIDSTTVIELLLLLDASADPAPGR